MRAALVPCEELAPPPDIQENLSRVRGGSDHGYSREVVMTTDAACEEETHSWWHFNSDQLDSYWIRCTLIGSHDEHKDENTGLTWKSSSSIGERVDEMMKRRRVSKMSSHEITVSEVAVTMSGIRVGTASLTTSSHSSASMTIQFTEEGKAFAEEVARDVLLGRSDAFAFTTVYVGDEA